MHEDLCVCVCVHTCVRACVYRGCCNINESIKIDTGEGIEKLWRCKMVLVAAQQNQQSRCAPSEDPSAQSDQCLCCAP